MSDTTPGGTVARAKGDLRRRLLASRRARSDADRREDAELLAAALPALLERVADPVCLHVAVGAEPGATPDAAARLPEVARTLGRRVLLPVTVGDAPLDWAEYDGPANLGPGPHGLLEPIGPRRGPDAVADAGLVLVPALAVDRRGVRLGRGGGHYDRSLPRAGAHTWLVALVADDGLVDELPGEPHDVAVHAVWRPRGGISALDLHGRAAERSGAGPSTPDAQRSGAGPSTPDAQRSGAGPSTPEQRDPRRCWHSRGSSAS